MLFAVWAGGRVDCFAVWAGGVYIFLLFRLGACLMLLLFGRGGACLFVLLFGRAGGGGGIFFAAWAGAC